jgi:hypothetical protein
VSIPARCGNCRRELLLDQLLDPSDGFRCPFCGYAFGELQAMIDGRLQLDRAAVVAPVADALPAEPQPA